MKKILVDCDPGLDDAIAIILAATSKKFELLGITIVDGNSEIELGSKNACILLHNIGLDHIPVYKGTANPNRFIERSQVSYNIHGKDGLGDLEIDRTIINNSQNNAVEFLKETLLNSSEKITIVAVGPLTNIANLITLYPDVKAKIAELVIMGGAVNRPGNITQYAEFNIYFDAVSAKTVLESDLNITLISLDATLKMLLTEKDVLDLKNAKNNEAKLAGMILNRYAQGYLKEYGKWTCPIHDATCILYLTNPEIIKFTNLGLSVITSEEKMGQTIKITNQNKLKVSLDGDADFFRKLIKECLIKGE